VGFCVEGVEGEGREGGLHYYDYYAAVADSASFGYTFLLFSGCVRCLCGFCGGFFEEECADGDAADAHVLFVAVVALAEDADGIFPLFNLSICAGFAIDNSRARAGAA
jgi:hypothetical protein